MADTDILIKIKADVEGLKTDLAKANDKLEEFEKTAKKNSDKVAQAFDGQVSSLIAMGNAAASVESIFASYNDLQMAIENSNERLIGSEDRLAHAKYNLAKVQQEVTSTSEDVAEAQRQVESATRSLTIAQNRHEKITGDVVKTYINMGVQSLNLIKSAPILIAQMEGVAAAIGSISVATAVATLGISALIAGAVYLGYQLDKTTAAQKENYVTTMIQNHEYEKLVDTMTLSKEQMQAMNTEIVKGTFLENFSIETDESKKNSLEDLNQKRKELIKSLKDQIATQNLVNNDPEIKDLEKQLDLLKVTKDARTEVIERLRQQIETQKLMNNDPIIIGLQKEYAELQKVSSAYDTYLDKLFKVSEKIKDYDTAAAVASGHTVIVSDKGGSTKIKQKQNDFVMRPGEGAVPFSPQDTIIGVKNPGSLGGNSITINIDSVSGADPDDIAEALQKKLSTLLR